MLCRTWRSDQHDDRSLDSLDALIQMIVVVWLFTMLVDEISSIFTDGYNKWASSVWNWLETFMLTFCFVGFAFRFSADAQYYEASKAFNGIGAFLLWG